MLDKPRLFISGGSGLLAVNWAMTMREHYEIHLALHKRIVHLEGVKFTDSNLESVDALLIEIGGIRPVAIIHTAGLTDVEMCERNPTLARLVNVELAKNIAKVSKLLNIPLVHISTDHLYMGVQGHTTEQEPTNPINIYGQTKAEAEQEVLKYDAEALIIRTNFYAWGPPYRQSFSDRILNSLRNDEPMKLFSDVYYTPVLAEVLILTIHKLISRQATGIFNIGSDDTISKYDFGIIIASEFELNPNLIIPCSFESMPGLVKRPANMSLSNDKVVFKLGARIGSVRDHVKRLRAQEKESITKEIHLL